MATCKVQSLRIRLEVLSKPELITLLLKLRAAYMPNDKRRVACGDVRWFIEDTLDKALYDKESTNDGNP